MPSAQPRCGTVIACRARWWPSQPSTSPTPWQASWPRSARRWPRRTCWWSTMAPPTAPLRSLGRLELRFSCFRSTSGSAAPCERRFATRASTGSISWCRWMPTASTSPRTPRGCWPPCPDLTRRAWSSGEGSPPGTRSGVRDAGPCKCLPARCHACAARRSTDTTSGFRAADARAIALFAEHYPAEYLGDTVESLVLAARAGLTIREVPVTMRPRQGGAASHSPFRASLQLGRAMLALYVALAGRRTAPAIPQVAAEPQVPGIPGSPGIRRPGPARRADLRRHTAGHPPPSHPPVRADHTPPPDPTAPIPPARTPTLPPSTLGRGPPSTRRPPAVRPPMLAGVGRASSVDGSHALTGSAQSSPGHEGRR